MEPADYLVHVNALLPCLVVYYALSIQKNAIKPYKSFVIIDDLLATGGTVECVAKILSSQQKKVTGLNVVIELSELNGSSKFNFPVSSQVNY